MSAYIKLICYFCSCNRGSYISMAATYAVKTD